MYLGAIRPAHASGKQVAGQTLTGPQLWRQQCWREARECVWRRCKHGHLGGNCSSLLGGHGGSASKGRGGPGGAYGPCGPRLQQGKSGLKGLELLRAEHVLVVLSWGDDVARAVSGAREVLGGWGLHQAATEGERRGKLEGRWCLTNHGGGWREALLRQARGLLLLDGV